MCFCHCVHCLFVYFYFVVCKIVQFLSLKICYVIYDLLWIMDGWMEGQNNRAHEQLHGRWVLSAQILAVLLSSQALVLQQCGLVDLLREMWVSGRMTYFWSQHFPVLSLSQDGRRKPSSDYTPYVIVSFLTAGATTESHWSDSVTFLPRVYYACSLSPSLSLSLSLSLIRSVSDPLFILSMFAFFQYIL